MKGRWNSEFLFQGLICILLSVLFVYALLSGRASNYIHPRLYGFLWFSAAALLFLAVVTLRFSSTPKHNTRPFKNLIIMLPIFSALVIPAGAVQNQAVSFANSAGALQNTVSSAQNSASSYDKGVIIPDTVPSEDDIGIEPSVSSNPSSSTSVPSTSPGDSKGITSVSDEQFANWYQDINQNMKKYEGKTIKMKGQVFRMNTFAKNEFVPVRYAMVCCAADLQPCGVLCRSNKATQYKENDWVWVTGKIKIENYLNQTMPVCYVIKIEKAEKAKEDYIYFTY